MTRGGGIPFFTKIENKQTNWKPYLKKLGHAERVGPVLFLSSLYTTVDSETHKRAVNPQDDTSIKNWRAEKQKKKKKKPKTNNFFF